VGLVDLGFEFELHPLSTPDSLFRRKYSRRFINILHSFCNARD